MILLKLILFSISRLGFRFLIEGIQIWAFVEKVLNIFII